MGYTPDMQSMKGIGYKEVLFYLNGDISLDEAIYLIKKEAEIMLKDNLLGLEKIKDLYG